MSALLSWYEADGTTRATRLDWGVVAPGQGGAAIVRVVKNEGDTPARNVDAVIRQIGNMDMEGWVTGTIGAQTFTSGTPLRLPDIPVNGSVTVSFTLAVPANAPRSSLPVMAYPGLEYDEAP